MNNKILKSLIQGCAVLSVAATINLFADGNRYDLPRLYHSEISAAKAYMLTNHDKGNVGKSDFANAVLIDVRTVEEYAAGHPPKAYNIPFPHIQSRPNKENYIGYSGATAQHVPQEFVDHVLATISDLDTPILMLCRTGYRSVLAGNLLSEAGYTNVRNIWQGFVGNTKVDTAGNILDLNNNGEDGDAGDKDGWSGYQELPVSTMLRPKLIYAPYAYLYY